MSGQFGRIKNDFSRAEAYAKQAAIREVHYVETLHWKKALAIFFIGIFLGFVVSNFARASGMTANANYNPANVTITGGTIVGTSVTLPGTPGNTTPGSGIVGEQLSNSTNTTTSGVWLSTALTIPAGLWLVQADNYFQATNASTTFTVAQAGIATSSGTPPNLTALTRQDHGGTTLSTAYYYNTQNIKIMAFTTPTTLYGTCFTSWAVSTATASCYITATRIF